MTDTDAELVRRAVRASWVSDRDAEGNAPEAALDRILSRLSEAERKYEAMRAVVEAARRHIEAQLHPALHLSIDDVGNSGMSAALAALDKEE